MTNEKTDTCTRCDSTMAPIIALETGKTGTPRHTYTCMVCGKIYKVTYGPGLGQASQVADSPAK